MGNIRSREGKFEINIYTHAKPLSWRSSTHVKTCSSALIEGLYLPPTRPCTILIIWRFSWDVLIVCQTSLALTLLFMPKSHENAAQPWLQHCDMNTDSSTWNGQINPHSMLPLPWTFRFITIFNFAVDHKITGLCYVNLDKCICI